MVASYRDVCPEPLMLSVVVPVYNNGRQLAVCLERLFESEYPAFEVIVVDDGSTDTSLAVAFPHSIRLITLPVRSGPAAARNAGARLAQGDYLVFIDADVFVYPDTLAALADTFNSDPAVDAVFGSYDTTPTAPNFISHYKNLIHHYVHQSSHERASTFWSGCGAIKKHVFHSVGGFDTAFTRPTIEDIELGVRLHRAGHRIVLNKRVQVTHAKVWTLGRMIKSDICERAIPWTALIFREKSLPNDLNLTWVQRTSALFACGLFVVLGIGIFRQPPLLLIPLIALALVLGVDSWSARGRIPNWGRWVGVFVMLMPLLWGGFVMRELALAALFFSVGIVALNTGFYRFFVRTRDPLFALAVFPLHLLYFAYSTVSFVLVMLWHWSGLGSQTRPANLPDSDTDQRQNFPGPSIMAPGDLLEEVRDDR